MKEATVTLAGNHLDCEALLVLHELLTCDLDDTVADLVLGLRIPATLLLLLEALAEAGAFDDGVRDGWTDGENRFMDRLWEVHQAYMAERGRRRQEEASS